MRTDDISSALFDAYDIKQTLKSYKLGGQSLLAIKRVHEGTDNEDSLEDLLDNVIHCLEKWENENDG